MDESPKKRKIDVEVDVKATGMRQSTSDMKHLGEAALPGLAAMVQSGSAMQGAIAGMGVALKSKFLGPLGGAIGTIFGIIGGFKLMGAQLDQVARGVGVLSRMETFENQFKPLLKGAGAAKERIAELYRFAAVTPFRIGEIAGANKNLELLTRGGFSSERAMRMVGDAASVSGEDIGGVSLMIGRLYDNLKAGRPIGEYSYRLQEMGIFSSELTSKLEMATDAGADFGTKWALVEAELRKSEGAMRDNSATLVGLQSTLEDTRDAFASSFSGKFLDAEKQSIRATTAVLEAATPAAKEFAGIFAFLKIPISTTIDSFVEKIARLPATASALKGAGLVAGIGTVAMIGAKLGEAAGGVARYTRLVREMDSARMGDTTKFDLFGNIKNGGLDAVNALAAVTVKIGELRGKSLGDFGAFDIKKVTSWKSAWENAYSVVKLGAKGIGFALKTFIWEPLVAIASLIAANPITAAIGAIVGVTAAWYYHTKGIHDEMKGIADATAESRNELDRMIASASTMEEKTTAIAKAYQTLIAAQKALNEAKEEGKDDDIIKKRKDAVDSADDSVEKAKKIREASLRGYQVEIEQAQKRAELEREANDAARDALIERTSGEEKIALMKERASELVRRADVAESAAIANKKVADEQALRQGDYDAAAARQDDAEADGDPNAERNKAPFMIRISGDSETGENKALDRFKEQKAVEEKYAREVLAKKAGEERIAAAVARFGAAYAPGTTEGAKAQADIKLDTLRRGELPDAKNEDKATDTDAEKKAKAKARKEFARRQEDNRAILDAFGNRVAGVNDGNRAEWSKEQARKINEDPAQARQKAIEAQKRSEEVSREESIEARKRHTQSATDTASGGLTDLGEARARQEYAIRKAGQDTLDQLEREAAEARWKAFEREAAARKEVITMDQLAGHEKEMANLKEQQDARRAQVEQQERDRRHRVEMARKDQRERMEIEDGKADVKFGRGSARAVQGMEDKKAIVDRASELKTNLDISDEDARTRAMREKRAELLNGAQIPQVVADSLQSIGGGGNYYAGGTDPQLAVAMRMESLQKDQLAVLNQINRATNNGAAMN